MKILMLSPYFYPEGGGLERYAFKLAKDLAKEHEVTVVCATRGKEREEEIGNIKVIRKKPNFILSNTPIRVQLPFEVIKIAKKTDLIIAHTPVPFYADVASLVGKILGIDVVVFYHTGELVKGSLVDILARVYEKTVERITLRNTRIIAVSRYVQRVLKRKRFRAKVRYPPVDEAFLRAEPNYRGSYVLFVGQLGKYHRWKNLELLLRAMKGINGKLVVVGDGDLREYYIREARRLGVDAEFKGFVSKEDLVKIYKNAKVLVLPSSKSEGFGMVVIEAMLLGTPVVVTGVGELPVIVEDGKCGIVIGISEKDINRALRLLLENEKIRRKMGVIGRRRSTFLASRTQDFLGERFLL
ncbi:glycosyl transferase [Thermococcus chitonophagus]|uniref:Glycosyl transferase n=1 Tax=Thermococcus chitonophagus TaxID=54262 RepID=A0A160VRC6_9EURY|nr:glycosyltransferase family 4 protein [Thermococcus chitonophagus]ASJ16064.1 glycosyl transferase [Thermococcus chitonophagus]CUX77310.1 Glycosyl transferase, group 1 [Thermococcus chitonophagus]